MEEGDWYEYLAILLMCLAWSSFLSSLFGYTAYAAVVLGLIAVVVIYCWRVI